MSDGLRLISVAISVGSAAAITSMPLDLFIENERPVAEFVRDHYRQYRDLPAPNTVRQETGVVLPATTEPLAFYADKLYERHEYTLLRDRFGALREGLSTGNLPTVRAAVASMSQATRQSSRRGLESLPINLAMEQVYSRIDRTRGHGGISGIETAWPRYNRITGGYQNGDLISLVGRMGLGKTYIALHQAAAAHAAGENVLFVTTEMGTEQIARRDISVRMGINPQHLRDNTVSTHTERRIRSFYRSMIGADRFQIFSVGMNASVSSVEAFMQEFGPTIVFVDGVYLLKPTNGARGNNRQERVTLVYDELKGITLESNVPMVCTTQFSRAAGKGGLDGSLENIGYSDAIGTHSSVVVGIKTGPTTNPFHSRYLEFLKGREGERGQVPIHFRFAPLNLDEIAHEELAAVAAQTAVAEASVDWMA